MTVYWLKQALPLALVCTVPFKGIGIDKTTEQRHLADELKDFGRSPGIESYTTSSVYIFENGWAQWLASCTGAGCDIVRFLHSRPPVLKTVWLRVAFGVFWVFVGGCWSESGHSGVCSRTRAADGWHDRGEVSVRSVRTARAGARWPARGCVHARTVTLKAYVPHVYALVT